MDKCPICRAAVADGTKECPACGAPLVDDPDALEKAEDAALSAAERLRRGRRPLGIALGIAWFNLAALVLLCLLTMLGAWREFPAILRLYGPVTCFLCLLQVVLLWDVRSRQDPRNMETKA